MAKRIDLEVSVELDGQRLDKVLATLLGLSRAQARTLVDAGVTIAGAPAGPSDRLSAGTVISSPEPQAAVGLRAEEVDFDVLYEDDSVLVVNKPSGVVVHPGSGQKTGTLAAGLLHRFPEIEGVGQADRWGLVHRLDRDTSGALIVARTSDSYEALSAMIRGREVTRMYTALASGVFGSPTGAIDAPIGRDPRRPTRRAVVPGGKEAQTHYVVDRQFDDCSLLTVRLETGRTHQIRVHLAAIDHPVIGDRTYSTKTTATTSPRIFLHARSVEFVHPDSGDVLAVEAPLPADLKSVLDDLIARSSG